MDTNNRKRILIIDDDPDINNLFKIYLEHDGFQADALQTQLIPCTILKKMNMT